MEPKKLFHRNFTMVVVGQIISLMGSAIVTFALPLHLLRVTGSAAVFGTVMAVSLVPALLLSPFGGTLADRVNRRDVMVVLDFLTCALLLCASLFIDGAVVSTIAVVTMLLTIIRHLYQPAVNACIPSITADQHLLRANSIVNTVNAVSLLSGPILGGFFYAFWGITPILYLGAAAFCASAIMELFLQLPFSRQPRSENIFQTVRQDFADSGRFILRERPVIGKTILIATGVNLVVSSLINIGIPYLINITLGLSSELYGLAQSVIGAGMLMGGILVGALAGKLTLKRYHWTLLGVTITLPPIGLALLWNISAMGIYRTIMISCFLLVVCSSMLSIAAMTLVQQMTPVQDIGKVMALTFALSGCAAPLGQAAYGLLFQVISRQYLIFFGAGAASLVLWAVARRAWGGAVASGALPQTPQGRSDLP